MSQVHEKLMNHVSNWEDDYYRSDIAKAEFDRQIEEGIDDHVFVHEYLTNKTIGQLSGGMYVYHRHNSNRPPLRTFNVPETKYWLKNQDLEHIKSIAREINVGEFETGVPPRFSLEDLNAIRARMGSSNKFYFVKASNKKRKTIIINIAMFKGGVGKTTTSLYLSQYLAMMGMKVLIVDTDPQSSISNYFGYIPLYDVENVELDTIKGLFTRPISEKPWNDLRFQKTNWPTIDLVLSHPDLNGLESQYVNQISDDPKEKSYYYWDAIKEAKKAGAFDAYDVVVVDTPPAINDTTISFAFASDILLITNQPTPVSEWTQSDLHFYISDSIRKAISINGSTPMYRWVRMLPSIVEPNLTETVKADLDRLGRIYSGENRTLLFEHPIYRRIPIADSSNAFSTLYETETSEMTQSIRDAKKMLNTAFEQIHILIEKEWTIQESEED